LTYKKNFNKVLHVIVNPNQMPKKIICIFWQKSEGKFMKIKIDKETDTLFRLNDFWNCRIWRSRKWCDFRF